MCKASKRINQKGLLLRNIVSRLLFEGFSLITNISMSSSLKVCFWIKHLRLSTFELSFLLFPVEFSSLPPFPFFFLISKSSFLLLDLFCLDLSDTLYLAPGPFVTMTTTSWYQQRISLLSEEPDLIKCQGCCLNWGLVFCSQGTSYVWSFLYFICEPGKANFLCSLVSFTQLSSIFCFHYWDTKPSTNVDHWRNVITGKMARTLS